jgi:hypothetical protein
MVPSIFGCKTVAELLEINKNLIGSPLTPAQEAAARRSRRMADLTLGRFSLNSRHRSYADRI